MCVDFFIYFLVDIFIRQMHGLSFVKYVYIFFVFVKLIVSY